jgi:hypothetical protein
VTEPAALTVTLATPAQAGLVTGQFTDAAGWPASRYQRPVPPKAG